MQTMKKNNPYQKRTCTWSVQILSLFLITLYPAFLLLFLLESSLTVSDFEAVFFPFRKCHVFTLFISFTSHIHIVYIRFHILSSPFLIQASLSDFPVQLIVKSSSTWYKKYFVFVSSCFSSLKLFLLYHDSPARSVTYSQ